MEEEVNRLLQEFGNGQPDALEKIFALVYKDLRSRAAAYLPRQTAGHTLQPTALVHEAFMRFARQEDLELRDRDHFFALAATTMRQILVDHARSKRRLKRGGARERVPLADNLTLGDGSEVDLVELDDALNRLAAEDERLVRIVELRFFAGMTVEDTARVLNVGTATVKRGWRFARVWLMRELSGGSRADIS